MKYQITKEYRFEMAHVLSNYQGRCGNIHGHSYRCLVTIEGDNLGNCGEEGMLMDFGELKRRINLLLDNLDHAFAYNKNSTDEFENEVVALCKKYNKRIFGFETRTTAEEMSKYIFEKINGLLDEGVRCSKIQLFETTTGSATYEGEEK